MKWLERDTVRAPYLCLCLTEEDFLRTARHCKLKNPDEWLSPAQNACAHTWSKDGAVMCVVCLSPERGSQDPIAVAASLVHESVHVFQRLCESIGETSPSKEFEAYSIERIAERLMREFVRQTSKLAG
jgi:hypothetical protein